MAAQLSFIRYPGRSGRELPAMNATGTGFDRTTVIGARPSLAGICGGADLAIPNDQRRSARTRLRCGLYPRQSRSHFARHRRG